MLTKELQHKINQAKFVMEDALAAYPADKSLVAWSAGKDSTLLLRLLLDVCIENGLTPPAVLDIDQKDAFEELERFRDDLVNQWDLRLLIVRNDDLLDKLIAIGDSVEVEALDEKNRAALAAIDFTHSRLTWIPDSPECNHLLKTAPINQAIENLGVGAMYTGIRWDEHAARAGETYFSERTSPNHMRIHPLLHFSERDVWDATFALKIPFCELYYRGYRSLGTKHGTTKNSDIPAWEQNLEDSSERGCRSQEKEQVMAQLRALGYM